MSFTTPFFLFIFFPLSVALYYGAAALETWMPGLKKLRLSDLVLLGMSLVFFGWGILKNTMYLLVYILAVYALGRLLAARDKQGSRWILALGVTLLLGVLYLYKYHTFTATTINGLAGRTILPAGSLAPLLGISYLTFAAISYLVDIRRELAPAGNLLDAALYLAFFPKMLSGPIVLWRDFGPQLACRSRSVERFVSGLNRIMIGFAKKLILADTFGGLCAKIQAAAETGIDVPTAWGCAFLFMLQLYYDFSGYSDMAIGLCRLFGFDVKENFDFPYVSTSITEFWRRWHISLGTWFKEYVYIPLGGSRRGKTRTLINLTVVFLLTGLWHEAGWGYICWGALQAVCRVTEKCLDGTKFYRRVPTAVKYVLTMFLTMMGMEAFRLPTMGGVIRFAGIMFGAGGADWIRFSFPYYFDAKICTLTAIAVIGATALAIPQIRDLPRRLAGNRVWFVVQELFLLALMALAVVFMVNSAYSPFIYFRY